MSAPVMPHVSSGAAGTLREIAIIDDAFVPLTDADFDAEAAAELYDLIATDPKLLQEASELGIPVARPEDVNCDFVDRLAQPGSPKALLYAAALKHCRRLEERRDMLTFAQRLQEQLGGTVRRLPPVEDGLDVRMCQVVFLDYFLEGTHSESGGRLAMALARRIGEQSAGAAARPLIVLMSSDPNVKQFKEEFQRGDDAYVGGFMFVAKRDMDETWKLRAHLQLLAGAQPRAALIHAYTAAIPKAIDDAKRDLIAVLRSLDITDYAFLHNVALHADGQPLGGYLAWLFSSHLTSLVFERTLREQEAAVDTVTFGSVLMTPSAPSLRVADLYQSALFEQELGPLAGHPQDTSKSIWLPVLRLGDVFVNEGSRKAVVVLSAACDLAFSPRADRPPNPERSVILVRGTLRDVRAAGPDARRSRTDFYRVGESVYEIEWAFADYVTRALREVPWFLDQEKCDVQRRVRLRPLYALKLQAEFAAATLRIGVPVSPPVLRPVSTQVWRRVGTEMTRVETLAPLNTAVYRDGGGHKAIVTLEIATVLQQAFAAGIPVAEHALATIESASDPKGHAQQQARSDREAFITARDDDAFWERLVSEPLELPAGEAPKKLAKRALYVTFGGEPDAVAPGKACVVWRLDPAEES